MKRFKKQIYLALGWFFVILGVIGAFLPLLPTTPFLLLAAWFFTRSSPQLAVRLRNHRLAGPYLRDWQDYGAIPIRAKLLAIVMMAGAAIYSVRYSHAPSWAAWLVVAVLACTGAYIVTRPSRP